jgi:hypothetical protein
MPNRSLTKIDLQRAKGVDMSNIKKIQYGISGFMLSLVTIVLTAVSLQFITASIWTAPQSFLVSYATTFTVLVSAIVFSWFCLLRTLNNEAMIRGIWYQIYAFVGIAIVGLLVALFS